MQNSCWKPLERDYWLPGYALVFNATDYMPPKIRTSLLNFRNLGPTAPSTPSYPSRSFAGAPTMPISYSSVFRKSCGRGAINTDFDGLPVHLALDSFLQRQ